MRNSQVARALGAQVERVHQLVHRGVAKAGLVELVVAETLRLDVGVRIDEKLLVQTVHVVEVVGARCVAAIAELDHVVRPLEKGEVGVRASMVNEARLLGRLVVLFQRPTAIHVHNVLFIVDDHVRSAVVNVHGPRRA